MYKLPYYAQYLLKYVVNTHVLAVYSLQDTEYIIECEIFGTLFLNPAVTNIQIMAYKGNRGHAFDNQPV